MMHRAAASLREDESRTQDGGGSLAARERGLQPGEDGRPGSSTAVPVIVKTPVQREDEGTETHMLDAAFLLGGIILFGLMLAYVRLCEKL